MNCPNNENVCSVKKENNLGYYRLHTIWRKYGFFINITSKNGAWRGEMMQSDIAKMSAQLDIDPDSYLNQCKEALTCHGGQPGIVYAVENGTFSWKKVEDEDSGIKIKLGSVMVEPTNFEDTIQNLVTAALNCNKNLQEKLNELTEEKRKITDNNNELMKKLNKFIKTKETMENDLYARFILLINSKKRKIKELEKLVEKCRKNKSITLSESDDSYKVDTDEDSGKEEVTERVNIVISKSSHSPLPVEEPEKKKAKNEDEKAAVQKSDFSVPSCSQINCSEQRDSLANLKDEPSEMSLTKDELYDYFYGEL